MKTPSTTQRSASQPRITSTRVADQRDAVRAIAKANGLIELFASAPPPLHVDVGKVVIFGDAKHEWDWLHDRGVLGVRIEVVFNQYGEVRKARKTLDNELLATVTDDRGDAGSRLLWTLQMFDGGPCPGRGDVETDRQ